MKVYRLILGLLFKVFLCLTAFLLASILIETGIENFLDWAFENAPWMIVVFFVLLVIFLALNVIFIWKKSYEKDPEKAKKHLIAQLKSKELKFAIGTIIVGLIMIFCVKLI